MKKSYKSVFVFTPVYKEDEAKTAIKNYLKLLTDRGVEIVEEEFWGIRQLAYPIKKKTTGIYFVLEFKGGGADVDALEIALKRDVNVLRFLTVALDKYSAKYYDERRRGLVGRNKKKKNADTAGAEATEKNEG